MNILVSKIFFCKTFKKFFSSKYILTEKIYIHISWYTYIYIYTAFRCCYCGFWNPARKQKPSAPKLDFDSPPAVLNTSEANPPCNMDEEPIKLTELETGTQSDTGIISLIFIYIDFSSNLILIYLLPIFFICSMNNAYVYEF